MPIDPARFWGNNEYRNSPWADAMRGAAEQGLGVRLPTEYIDLLRIQNGGYTRGFDFPMSAPTSWAPDCIPLFELSGIGSADDPSGHNIYNRDYMTREWGLPDNQILLAGDGHWWITLDYRRGPVPSVSWIDVEVHQDVIAARTFAEFIAGLRAQASPAS